MSSTIVWDGDMVVNKSSSFSSWNLASLLALQTQQRPTIYGMSLDFRNLTTFFECVYRNKSNNILQMVANRKGILEQNMSGL